MTKTIDYYLKKIISASDGPLMAERLSDALSNKIIKPRKGKDNIFKKRTKSVATKEFENLETAISRIMRQTTEESKASYALVIDRIHKTGMDTLFEGPVPPSIKIQLETEKLISKEKEKESSKDVNKEVEKQVDKETDEEIDKQVDKQVDKQGEKDGENWII